MIHPVDQARRGFYAVFGAEPAGVSFAPGRVNLIGDHVDYNDGLVLPMPITPGTAVAWARHDDDEAIEAAALNCHGQRATIALSPQAGQHDPGWQTYLGGMIAALRQFDLPVPPARLAIAGNLPQGAGLSSSASFCVSVGQALCAAAGSEAPPARSLALAAQHAEHHWAGVACGIMDQLVIAAGRCGTPLLIDCRNLDVQNVPLPDHWGVLIVQSGVNRGLVDGQYNERRRACQAAAAALGLGSLRDFCGDMTSLDALDPVLARRARHVVEEIDRVRQAARAIEASDLAKLGQLMNRSHESLRDLYEVSHPAVDDLAALMQRLIGECGGARMTGGGFGGAVVGVMPLELIDDVLIAVRSAYRPPGGGEVSAIVETAGTPCRRMS